MLFTSASLLILAVALLLVVALSAVSNSRFDDARRIWFRWHLLTSLMFILCVFLDDSLYGMQVRVFYLLEYPTVLMAALTYGELCYSVAGEARTKHRRIYRFITAGASLVWAGGYAWALSTGQGFQLLLLLPIALFCWPLVVLGVRLARQKVPLLSPGVLWQEGGINTDSQKAMLGFFYGTVLRAVGSAAPLMTVRQQFPAEFVYGTFFVLSLLIVMGMVVTYLSFIEKRANLAYKITSFLSVFLISSFVVVVLAFYQEDQELRPRDLLFMEQNSVEFAPEGSGFEISASPVNWRPEPFTRLASRQDGAYQVALSFDFPFAGESFKQLFIYESGQITPAKAGEQPAYSTTPFQRRCISHRSVLYALCLPGARFDVFVAEGVNQIAVRWVLEGGEQPAVEAVLTRTGNVRYSYGDFPKSWSQRRDAFVGINLNDGEPAPSFDFDDMPLVVTGGELLFDLGYGRRQQTHRQLWPVVVFLVASVAVILWVFRPYIGRLIVRPLVEINAGLRKVDEGQLDYRLETTSKDEFSDLVDGFNRMIVSLGRERQRSDEQTELLEAEITFRTVEAAKKIDPTILSKDQVFETSLLEAISANIGDFDFQVAELAEAMAVSTRQLHRRVVNLTAQTPAALIRAQRLEHAHALLNARAANVSEACYQSGFRDVSYFSKLFQKKYGVSPSSLIS